MPHGKRPLAEIDPNASKPSLTTKYAKTSADAFDSKRKDSTATSLQGHNTPVADNKIVIRRPGERWENKKKEDDLWSPSSSNKQGVPGNISRYLVERNPVIASKTGAATHNGYQQSALPLAENKVDMSHSENKIDYTTKDNSKLQTILRDRGLLLTGSRKDWIRRLEISRPFEYKKLPSDELTEMLKRRNLHWTALGSKDFKASRLMLNDELDHDTGNSEECQLYSYLSVYEDIAAGRLGEPTDPKRREEAILKRESLKRRLEAKVGHPVNATAAVETMSHFHALDNQLLQRDRTSPPKPICAYQWKDSHWASRTERQLREICDRQEMPGSGPKAAMIKWLETGDVDYGDLYAFSLERMCSMRGIKVKSEEKKATLIKILQKDDDAQNEG